MMNAIPQARMDRFFVLLIGVIFSVTLLSASGTVFANDIGLIEADALMKGLDGWVVLDARPKSEWGKKHLPGALSLSWEDYTRTDEHGVPYRVWLPHELARALGAMGIDEKTPIVVYGDADTSWGGEGWVCWVLSWIGHRGPIRLLNGGIQSWTKSGYPIVEGAEEVVRKSVHYQHRVNPAFHITASEIVSRKRELVLVDTRSTLEILKGRIPGAIHIPWSDFYSGKDRRPLRPDTLRALLKKHRVDTTKTVVYYCTGGIRSAFAWYVHLLSGVSEAMNYEGGYEEWRRSESR